jgi:Tfp pilus assembly pilus retraction ATPase PilT
MITIEKSLADLVKRGVITLEMAQSWSIRPEELARLVRNLQ